MSFPFEQFIHKATEDGHSQKFIDICIEYAKSLESKKYPVLFSLPHVAISMGVQSDFLKKFIGENEGFVYYKIKKYNQFFIKKRKGGYREIMAPHKDLKYIQKWLLFNILSKYPLADSCKGFRSQISIRDNALPHSNAKVILKIDLLKFYDTITEKRVYGMFSKMGYAKNLSYSLAKLCTAKHTEEYWNNFKHKEKTTLGNLYTHRPPTLPQGAPSSPTIANIVATKMDKRFEALSHKMGFNYTRYADDLTFSIHSEEGKLPSVKLIRKIIREEDFFVNDDKITYMHRGSKQYVTGLSVTDGVHTSKKYRKQIARHIHFCRKYGVENHLFKIQKDFPYYNPLKFHDWLYGHICFIHSIDVEYSKKLLSDFNKITWKI